MVKTKLRLGIIVLSGLAIVFILLILELSPLTDRTPERGEGEEVLTRLRKLNQPFSWGASKETSSSSPSHPDHSTCRNSVQGSVEIADDRGYVCLRKDIESNGCCDLNQPGTFQFACFHCRLKTGCCKTYEHCISCCMNPDKKPYLMSVLNEARALSNILLLSVSDQFELCLAKCRTSSKSVQHENMYRNPENKFCYMKSQAISNSST